MEICQYVYYCYYILYIFLYFTSLLLFLDFVNSHAANDSRKSIIKYVLITRNTNKTLKYLWHFFLAHNIDENIMINSCDLVLWFSVSLIHCYAAAVVVAVVAVVIVVDDVEDEMAEEMVDWLCSIIDVSFFFPRFQYFVRCARLLTRVYTCMLGADVCACVCGLVDLACLSRDFLIENK